MKIGIVTLQDYWIHSNFGTLMQCYALQEFLRKHGHEPFLIRRDITPFRKDWKWALARAKHVLSSPLAYVKDKIWRRHVAQYNALGSAAFDAFVSKYLCTTPQLYKEAELMSCPPDADAYICGSDQVWGTIADSHFLAFAPACKRVFYAPSCSWDKKDKSLCQAITRHLGVAHAVSSREDSGGRLMKELLGRKVPVVVDPTLLLEPEQYVHLAESAASIPRKPYLLIYALNLQTKEDICLEEAQAYCGEKGLDLLIVASQGAQDVLPREKMLRPAPEEFLELILHADGIVTNSFHGTIFSILFQKPFVTIAQTGPSGKQNNRLQTLLERTELQDHMLTNAATQENKLVRCLLPCKPVLEQWRKQSADYLLSALAGSYHC